MHAERGVAARWLHDRIARWCMHDRTVLTGTRRRYAMSNRSRPVVVAVSRNLTRSRSTAHERRVHARAYPTRTPTVCCVIWPLCSLFRPDPPLPARAQLRVAAGAPPAPPSVPVGELPPPPGAAAVPSAPGVPFFPASPSPEASPPPPPFAASTPMLRTIGDSSRIMPPEPPPPPPASPYD